MRIAILAILTLFLIVSCKKDSDISISYTPPENANYQHEEVKIELDNGDILAGSLTFQNNNDKKNPIAILITGSSPHDRDNSSPTNPISAYRPFRQISHSLSSHGITVLRVDDRGIGQSKGGNIREMTTADRAEDIKKCVNYIRCRSDFDSSKIYLIGLSEGATIAHMIASEDTLIKGIILLSGIGSKGSDIINYQVNNGLIGKEELARILKKDRNMQYLHNYNPLETIRLIHQPVLIIHGRTDRRVPFNDAYILENELKKSGNINVSVHVLPDHNHALLKEDSSGIQTDYGKISSSKIPDDVLMIILSWIKREIRAADNTWYNQCLSNQEK